jgi:two-component system, OmpR family, sensor kinase
MERLHWCYAWFERLSLRWRLALLSFGLLAVLMGGFGLLISVTEENILLATQASVLNNQAQMVQASLNANAPHKDKSQKDKPPGSSSSLGNSSLPESDLSSQAATDLVKTISDIVGKDAGIALLSSNGTMLAADYGEHSGAIVILDGDTVQNWHSTHESYLLVTDSRGKRALVILQPLVTWDKFAQQDGKALLQLSIPTAAIDQSVASTRLNLLLGLLGTLTLAAILTLPLMGRALRPLVEMERVSQRIAGGALSLRLQEPVALDEVGQLARSFNSMVARLEKAFARQKQFVGDVSHELRTPLTALGGSLEMLLLEADSGDKEAAYRLTRGMYSEVERMQRLVADLLVLSRLDEGQIRLREETLDIGVLVQELAEQARQLARGQEIRQYIAAPRPLVQGDKDQLRRVLLNIIENALKYTPAGGRVTLTVSGDSKQSNNQMLLVEVGDTGIGIPPEALPHIFDRFYRVDQSRARTARQGGSGLGLSIAQGLIQAHGGTITLSSAPGQGTRVSIRLPALPQKEWALQPQPV